MDSDQRPKDRTSPLKVDNSQARCRLPGDFGQLPDLPLPADVRHR
jgi:hypothetical protein